MARSILVHHYTHNMPGILTKCKHWIEYDDNRFIFQCLCTKMYSGWISEIVIKKIKCSVCMFVCVFVCVCACIWVHAPINVQLKGSGKTVISPKEWSKYDQCWQTDINLANRLPFHFHLLQSLLQWVFLGSCFANPFEFADMRIQIHVNQARQTHRIIRPNRHLGNLWDLFPMSLS